MSPCLGGLADQVDLDDRVGADRPGDHGPGRVVGRLLGAEQPGTQHLAHPGVIGGELGAGPAADQVAATVADMGHDGLPPGQGQGGAGRGHPPLARFEGGVVDGQVGLADRRPQRRRAGRPACPPTRRRGPPRPPSGWPPRRPRGRRGRRQTTKSGPRSQASSGMVGAKAPAQSSLWSRTSPGSERRAQDSLASRAWPWRRPLPSAWSSGSPTATAWSAGRSPGQADAPAGAPGTLGSMADRRRKPGASGRVTPKGGPSPAPEAAVPGGPRDAGADRPAGRRTPVLPPRLGDVGGRRHHRPVHADDQLEVRARHRRSSASDLFFRGASAPP